MCELLRSLQAGLAVPSKREVGGGGKERTYHREDHVVSWINELELTDMKIEGEIL